MAVVVLPAPPFSFPMTMTCAAFDFDKRPGPFFYSYKNQMTGLATAEISAFALSGHSLNTFCFSFPLSVTGQDE